MKLGMMDVGIFCKEPRFGISTEKGRVPTRHAGRFYASVLRTNTSTQATERKIQLYNTKLVVNCSVFCFYLRLQYHQVPKSHPWPGGPQAELSLPVLH